MEDRQRGQEREDGVSRVFSRRENSFQEKAGVTGAPQWAQKRSSSRQAAAQERQLAMG
jgi:hypothetical protein